MNILLDTHVAIWAMTDDKRLSKRARDIMLDPGNNIYYSAASVLEVEMKSRSKKSNLEFDVDEFVQVCHMSGYIHAPLQESHILRVRQLEWQGDGEEHKDPVDRILLSQAITDNMRFMTADSKIPLFKQDCVISI